MKNISSAVEKISRILDRIAAFCIALTMAVVVLNVIMRAVINQPLLGTVEYVNILTALTVGLALANCAFHNGQIAVEFLVDKLPGKMQALIDSLTNGAALVFWTISAWYMVQYAQATSLSGEVSATTGIPMYPVVYLLAFSLVVLCMVIGYRLLVAVRMEV
ncbi:MAG: TRAP transporter small permease [Syntrophomonas sp.]